MNSMADWLIYLYLNEYFKVQKYGNANVSCVCFGNEESYINISFSCYTLNEIFVTLLNNSCWDQENAKTCSNVSQATLPFPLLDGPVCVRCKQVLRGERVRCWYGREVPVNSEDQADYDRDAAPSHRGRNSRAGPGQGWKLGSPGAFFLWLTL